ncbi:NAD-dependent protein deacetylase sirtuin-2-like [Cloeon dipterum]|uniref:NAD-dependent protein deacetylase sirtuin-2-like n=1 Tax=Cloeon dipterum TaxID=197152 RepID=UPI0032202120
MLHEKGLLLRHYTKNLDNLERAAGIPADKLVEAHGTFQSSHCIDCDHEYDFTWLNERIMNEIPKCECGGVVRPDIVFFGEDLTDRFTELGGNDLFECDLLIILGSSLEAQPFSSLVDKARSMVPRVLINRKIPPLGNPVLWGKGLSTGWNMSALDVTFQGECDVGCAKLAEAMDWATELRALYNTENGLNKGGKSPLTLTSRPIGKKLL